jgi:alcohol dehydrogenase (NADP+)
MGDTVTLNSGAKMPLVGLGTWQSPAGAVKLAVIAAIEAGVRHIDCAAAYGNEKEVGEGIADVVARGLVKREDLFVTSKLWPTRCHPDEVASALEQTLSDLKLDWLDLYLIHWPFFLTKGSVFPAPVENRLGYDAARYAAVWREMEAAVNAGKTRSIGTSNASAKKLAELLKTCTIRPAVNQVESHPFLSQRKELAWAQAHGIVVTAYSPLGSPDRPARLVAEGDPAPLFDETVLAIAAKHGRGAAQVLIRWQVQRGVVAIPKSVTPARIRSNFDVFSFALDADDLARLAALDRGHRLVKGLQWLREGETWESLWDTDFL